MEHTQHPPYTISGSMSRSQWTGYLNGLKLYIARTATISFEDKTCIEEEINRVENLLHLAKKVSPA